MTDRGYQVSLVAQPSPDQPQEAGDDAIKQAFDDMMQQGLVSTPSNSCDPKLGLFLCKQMLTRVDREMRFYFEFTVVEKMEWRVGLVSAKRADRNVHATYPGELNDGSMGFGSDGYM
jgi:hypothetical protein